MKRLRYIVIVVLCTFSIGTWSQDYARLGERTIMGTARYIGMGGAMTAIGGDPSAAHDNPAGLGLYRRTEALLTLGGAFDRTVQQGTDPMKRNLFEFPQASLVVCLPTFGTSGVQFHNFMFSYRQLHSCRRSMDAGGINGYSLGALLGDYDVPMDIPYCMNRRNQAHQLYLSESGYVDEFTFDYAMNISDRWYVGAGLNIQSYLLAGDGEYKETFDVYNEEGKAYANINSSKLHLTGTGCSLSLGLICRPLKWLRLGLSMQTPSIGALHTYTSGSFYARTDSMRVSYAPDLSYTDRAFHMPWHVSSSVAFQVGAYGMASLQYDFYHAKGEHDVHSMRAGIEVIPVMGMYINAGYAYESTFAASQPAAMYSTFERQDTYTLLPRWNQYASVAVGYRGTYMIVQAAYQYRWQKLDFYAHEAMEPYMLNADTHRFVVTIGWHRY